MAGLNFSDERISYTPVLLFADYINLQANRYLKDNFKNFTPRDFTYLANIFYHQNCSQRDLAEMLYVSEANVAQIIKRLEKNGYIERVFDESNKSRKILSLTEKGKNTVFSLMKTIFEWEAKFFEEYSEEEVMKFKKMLHDYSSKSIYP
ncbi:MarR family winged helix-turn-helix transcriptional regulator [Methanobrevibacter sp.]